MSFHSGFGCLVGRPNVGKSTLTNAMVGTKIAITSSRPQTTRHAIRAVINQLDGQLVMIDTPGMHKPHTVLGQRLNDLVATTWTEVDTVGLCLPADQKPGPGDAFIARQLTKLRKKPVLLLVTKMDKVTKAAGLAAVQAASNVCDEVGLEVAEVVPVSAHDGTNVQTAIDLFLATLPEGPPLYPPDVVTDEPEEVLIAEFIREAALDGVRDELPHSIAVTVEEWGPREGRPDDAPLLDIYAMIHVERESQKAIVIGRKGARLSKVGATARHSIQAMLGTQVYLNLHVRVAKDWQRDAKQLRRLGF